MDQNEPKIKHNKLCPVCLEKNITTKLKLTQIHYDKATYLCRDRKCSYPLGHKWIVVMRPFEKFAKTVKKMDDVQLESITMEHIKREIQAESTNINLSAASDSDELFSELFDFETKEIDYSNTDDLVSQFVNLEDLEDLLSQ